MKKWENYEQVATYLLNQFATEFGLEYVEGKQTLRGSSGTSWEIDAKGTRLGKTGYFLIECRMRNRPRPQQEIASLAYIIKDVPGENGGIIVSPMGLQKGAQILADSEGIISVILRPGSTCKEYFLGFLNKVMIGVADSASVKDSVTIEVRDEAGNLIERKHSE